MWEESFTIISILPMELYNQISTCYQFKNDVTLNSNKKPKPQEKEEFDSKLIMGFYTLYLLGF